MKPSQRTKTLLGVALAAALLALSACGGDGDDSADGSPDEASSQSEGAQAQQPDLDGIPDVVAEVNGEEVSRDDFVAVYEAQFRQAAGQAQQGGEPVDEDALKKQTADGLVDTELLRQEAATRDISATDTDVDDTLTDLAKQNQLASADEFLAALDEQGMSEDDVRAQIETQVVIERLVEDEVGSAEPKERELRKMYDDAVKQQKQAAEQGGQEQTIPPFKEVRSQLVEQAKSLDQGKAARALVKGLRKDADITIHL